MQEIPVVIAAEAKKLRRVTSSLNISLLRGAGREGEGTEGNGDEQKVTKGTKKGKK
jgi:hypothetical protein